MVWESRYLEINLYISVIYVLRNQISRNESVYFCNLRSKKPDIQELGDENEKHIDSAAVVELDQQSTISELKCQKYKTCHKHKVCVSAQSQVWYIHVSGETKL